ncbi:hypothetical protein ZWY2020_005553 [Hordeum vulgare]|nr:hypothetical protein ZWY2020_005553 [Hordeum vulgare]
MPEPLVPARPRLPAPNMGPPMTLCRLAPSPSALLATSFEAIQVVPASLAGPPPLRRAAPNLPAGNHHCADGQPPPRRRRPAPRLASRSNRPSSGDGMDVKARE